MGMKDNIWHSTAPPKEEILHIYHPNLVHIDFNPQGVVEATWNDGNWIGAVWNGYTDSWDTLCVQIEQWKYIIGPEVK
jgi:hypothetical protein